MSVRLPTKQNRTTVIGSTGSGKSQFAAWLLSTRDFDKRPWIIIDYKGDELIEEINAPQIDFRKEPPRKPGIYVIRPIPQLDDDAVKDFLWKIWARGNIGIWIDEGFMLGNRNPALNALLTQGRSKNIEMIILLQRPVWASRFIFSEANYFAIFNLTQDDDRKHVRQFTNGRAIQLLPDYHSTWYDVQRQKGVVLGPVPDRAAILETFGRALRRKTRSI